MYQPMNEALRQSRKRKGYTQEQLARQLHVSRQTISNWETGRANPDYELLKQISLLLETPLSVLLGMDEEAPPDEAPAEETAEEAEPTEAEAAPPQKHRLWPILLCALLALTAAAAFLLTRPDPSPKCPYSIAWFQQADEPVEGQAFVTITTLENPVKRSGYNDETTYNWAYSFILREKGGVSFTIDRMENYYFWGDDQWHMTEDFGSNLLGSKTTPILRANTTRVLTAQDTSQGAFIGVGRILYGTDANGNPLTFHCWIDYSTEIQ